MRSRMSPVVSPTYLFLQILLAALVVYGSSWVTCRGTYNWSHDAAPRLQGDLRDRRPRRGTPGQVTAPSGEEGVQIHDSSGG